MHTFCHSINSKNKTAYPPITKIAKCTIRMPRLIACQTRRGQTKGTQADSCPDLMGIGKRGTRLAYGTDRKSMHLFAHRRGRYLQRKTSKLPFVTEELQLARSAYRNAGNRSVHDMILAGKGTSLHSVGPCSVAKALQLAYNRAKSFVP